MNEESYSFTKEPEIFYYEFFSEGPIIYERYKKR
ncbi:MAG: hypothetical protein JWQ63_1640 [Mucilaginibacter sp.]|jgi:hypothetical protein|nr:hypothetical protein [Mucilaginibacter sp.]